MWKNDRGFTLIEGMLSVSVIFLLCLFLFPLVFTMLTKLDENKKELIAYRLLYEHVEQYREGESSAITIKKNRGVEYEVSIEKNEDGSRKACVYYEEHQKCIHS